MSKTPEKSVSEWNNSKSISSLAKKSWKCLRGGIYSLFNSREGIPCSEDEKCPYYWIKVWDVWKLLDAKWWKPILEADKVVDYVEDDMENYGLCFVESTPIIRIFHSDSGWWFIADDWTIVEGDYIDMGSYGLEIDNYEYTIISWKTLENWQEKTRYFSLKDWFKTDDLELMKQKCIEENPHHNKEKENSKKEKRKKFQENVKSTIKTTGKSVKENFDKFAVACIDEIYNRDRVFRREFSLKQWTKQWYSFMKNWKVWIMWILEPKYEGVAPCSDKYIWVKMWKKRWLLDADGNVVIDPEFDAVDGNAFEIDGKRWFINENGEALEPKYDVVYWNYVFVGKKCWFVDRKTGREVIEPKYDDVICPLKWCSVAVPVLWKKYGLISTIDGSIIKEIEYDAMIKDYKNAKITFFKKEVVNCKTLEKCDVMPWNIVKVAGKMWMVNKETGLEIIEPKYDKIRHPLKWCPVVLVKSWDNYWLISEIDWTIIKNVEFNRVKINSKKEKISFYKEDKVDCSPFKEAA